MFNTTLINRSITRQKLAMGNENHHHSSEQITGVYLKVHTTIREQNLSTIFFKKKRHLRKI